MPIAGKDEFLYTGVMKIPFRNVLTVIVLALLAASARAGADLGPFTSDGCSLFPDGTIEDRQKWCDCCFRHDIAYWQGGSDAERLKADEAFRDCVFEKTRDQALSETLYVAVRTGGHPVFPNWYRWAYGWPYGRGYRALSDAEQEQVRARLAEYHAKHPTGYCSEKHPVTAPTETASRRPANWAAPVPSKHLRNFYRLDDRVYRSAQPDKKGFRQLERLGVKNVLSFRDYHSDDDAKGTSLRLFRIKMEAGEITDEKVVEALRIIRNAEGPILIHCWHGSDRTGLVSAIYRIVFQNWSKEDAIEELTKGGYGYHSLYKNIPEYIRKVDVEKMKKEVQAP